MTLKENIQAVLDSNFSETREEIKETALQDILELIDNDSKHKQEPWEYAFETDKFIAVMEEKLIHIVRKNSPTKVIIDRTPPLTYWWKVR